MILSKQLIEIIKSLKQGTEVVLDSRTNANARKNPYGKIFKFTCSVMEIGGECYENAVNQELSMKGLTPEFVAESLPYGTWLVVGRIIAHNNEHFLRMQSTPDLRIRFPVKVLGYETETERELTKKQVASYLPPIVNAGTQAEVGLENIQEQVWIRNYKFSSIRALTINKIAHQI